MGGWGGPMEDWVGGGGSGQGGQRWVMGVVVLGCTNTT